MVKDNLGAAIKLTLGRNIKEFRAQKGLSQAQLAEITDISVTFISTIERGLKYPTAKVLEKIARSLDVEAWELFKGSATTNESASLVDALSADLRQKINDTMDTVFEKYGG
jgi:transcriptional regulator with XRE-family HTH domain